MNISVQDVDHLLPPNMKPLQEVAARLIQERMAGEVEIVLVDDHYITQLNQRYRGIHAPTDVLAFDLSDTDGPMEDSLIGEVYISLERAQEQAQERGLPFIEEVGRLIFHGLLHLSGYDDETEADARRMEKEVEGYVDQLRGFLGSRTTRKVLGKDLRDRNNKHSGRGAPAFSSTSICSCWLKEEHAKRR